MSWKRFSAMIRLRTAAGFVLLLVVGLALLWLWRSGDETPASPRSAVRPPPPQADLWRVEWMEVPDTVAVAGSVTSDHVVQISARIQAHVTSVHASAGDAVTAGTVLMRLDDRDLRAELAAAEAALHQARTEFNRLRSLRDVRAATEQEVTAAESAYRTATARLEQVHVMLTYTEVASPLTGLVADRMADAGSLVYPGQPLFSVFDTNRMRFDAPVPSRLVPHIRSGEAVWLRVETQPEPITGQIYRLVAEKDPLTRTRLVQILIDDTDLDLLPGTFGRLMLNVGTRAVLQVPTAAIRRVGQLEKVFIVADGHMQTRLVKTGVTRDGLTEILSGLMAGETVLATVAELP